MRMGRQKDLSIYVGSHRSKGNITLPPWTLGIPDVIQLLCVWVLAVTSWPLVEGLALEEYAV